MIKVLLADDHRIFIDGIKALLQISGKIEVVGEAENGERTLELLETLKPDVVIIDVQMPVMNGVDTTREIVKRFPEVKILALTMLNETLYIKRMLEAGASGYIIKTADKEELIEGIETVARGEKYLGRGVTENLINNFSDSKLSVASPLDTLTKREKEILILIAQGLTDKEIAEKVFLSPLTVISHRKNMLSKLGLKNKVELTRFAIDHNLTQ